MKKLLLIAFLIVAVVIIGAIGAYVLLNPEIVAPEKVEESTFAGLEMGRAGDSGYAVFNHRGDANMTLVSLEQKPLRKITIINDTDGIEMERMGELVDMIEELEEYGFSVEVTKLKGLGEGIFVVPTGAIPNYVYDDLWYNATEATVLFIGQDDLVIRRGVKKENWYASLSEEQRDRVTMYEMTLDEMMDAGDFRIISDLMENSWARGSRTNRVFDGDGLKTIKTYMGDANYLRLIYEYPGGQGILDSGKLVPEGKLLMPDPPAVYPWEKSTLSFELNKTNGTSYLSIYKDGEGVLREELRRVTDDNYFLKRLEFEEPGEYVIMITDNDGTLASGFLHVYDLQVNLEEEAGVTYVFDVTVDGKPLKSAEAVVWLNNSTEKRDFFIYEGVLTVNAKLESGLNTFNVQVLGNTIPVEVRHSGSSLLEFYLTYGLPGLLLVGLVFIFARMSRRPMYLLRFSDIGNEVRKDVRLTPADAMMAFKRVRDEMRLGKSPLTSDEFSVALKRYITNGAEVTSGNVEEILNKMCRDGVLDTHRGYYQPRGEGDVKKNTLLRIAREKLIENGISFKSKKSKLVTKDFEIGFFGDSFKKKALLIVDDESEARKIISSMSDKERGMLDIKRSNDMLAFVPIAKLGGYI